MLEDDGDGGGGVDDKSGDIGDKSVNIKVQTGTLCRDRRNIKTIGPGGDPVTMMMMIFDNDDDDEDDEDNGGDNPKVRIQNQGKIETMRPGGIVRGAQP